MFSASSLVATLTLALAVAASPLAIREPLVTLPFAKRVNITGTANLLQRDQARAQGLKRLGQARSGGVVSDAVISVPATNELVDYVVNVGTQSVLLCIFVLTVIFFSRLASAPLQRLVGRSCV